MVTYVRVPASAEREVGSVFADIVVLNKSDEVLAAAGYAPPTGVRRIEVSGVLVDTGATTLCLPRLLIDELGLPVKAQIPVATAAGIVETTLYEQAEVAIAGRKGTVDCIALPDGAEPLLGVIPLELLGLEPDLTNRVLRVLPLERSGSYLRM